MQSPSRSVSVTSNATSRAIPRLRSVTEQLNPGENGLTTFLKRCNARNFSVKVRSADLEKESPSNVKDSEYILMLEPIEEGASKDDESNDKAKADDSMSMENANHDTKMMLYG